MENKPSPKMLPQGGTPCWKIAPVRNFCAPRNGTPPAYSPPVFLSRSPLFLGPLAFGGRPSHQTLPAVLARSNTLLPTRCPCPLTDSPLLLYVRTDRHRGLESHSASKLPPARIQLGCPCPLTDSQSVFLRSSGDGGTGPPVWG